MSFKLTYASMFNPPAELHARFDAALAEVRAALGKRHALHVDGADVEAAASFEKRSPIDRTLLGHFPRGDAGDVERAVAAARAAFPGWRATPWRERVALMKKVADLIEARVYHIAAAIALEVGKNRLEALAEVQETADFFVHYGEDLARHDGFVHVLPDDPLQGFRSSNRSVMQPYGVWAVVAPFNFPIALAGGPVAAALVTGNTVVLKGATDTPWAGRMLADCLRDAGLPRGVFNYLLGPGAEVGDALVGHPQVDGITFTGSYDVGMGIYRRCAQGAWPKPCIAEMGGKNATLVSRRADLERAALGIVRSGFGMGGQKCSALSRLYVEEPVADALIAKLAEKIGALKIGDPTRVENWLGPVINERARAKYLGYAQQLVQGGATMIAGGRALEEGELARGFYCAPTLAEAPLEHPLWQEEMFLPIVMLARVPDLDAGMALANASTLGLTAGFYGSEDEAAWFFERIEAGVTYANRPQGATTGAWPGYQPFGGWKGSGTTGHAIASFYYLAHYLREQSRTLVS